MYTEEQIRAQARKMGKTEDQITAMLATIPTLISAGALRTSPDGRTTITRLGKSVVKLARSQGKLSS